MPKESSAFCTFRLAMPSLQPLGPSLGLACYDEMRTRGDSGVAMPAALAFRQRANRPDQRRHDQCQSRATCVSANPTLRFLGSLT